MDKNKKKYFSSVFPLYFYVLMVWIGTVFQTVLLSLVYSPETSSRVTLASLGIVFQTNLVACLFRMKYQWIKIRKKHSRKENAL